MAYLRFLTDRDYCSIATEEHMKQIIRDVPDRIPQAEQRAEMQMREYLDQYYEIEKVLAVGKNIRDYNVGVTYPGQVWIKNDGYIYKTLTVINGIKKPTKTVYWEHIVDFIDPRLIDHAKRYSQLGTFARGEVVQYGTEYWQCETPHGYDAGEIHLPGVEVWKQAEATAWEPNMEWVKNQVCSYNGQFYQYLAEAETGEDTGEGTTGEETPGESSGTDAETVLTPEEDDNWGLIGEYSEELEYGYDEEQPDYVVAEDAVFYAVLNPNADALAVGVNITLDDPRNANVVAHLARIALYNLHQVISPTNISETRRIAYEDSVLWLYNASKFKINPQLPRKRECETGLPKTDWACETFQRDYNPYENLWLI